MPKRSVSDQLVPRVDGRPSPLRARPHLDGDPRRVFTEIVASVSLEHFRPGDLPLLEAYCETVALGRQAAVRLREDGAVVDGKASPWLAILDRCNRSLVPMAKALRLAPSTRMDRKTAGRNVGGFDAEALAQELEEHAYADS